MEKTKSNYKASFVKKNYEWLIIWVSTLTLFFSGPGQTYSVSVFINYYTETFGWGRTEVSSYYSLATLAAGLMLPAVGKAIDNNGQRKALTFISFFLGLATLWMSFVNRSLMLVVGFFFLRLLGQGSMTLIPSTLIPRWFVRSRGKALSIMGLGGVIGSAILPPMNSWLIINRGAPFAWRVWTILLIFVMMPIGWLLTRDCPEDIGLIPDRDKNSNIHRHKPKLSAKISPSSYDWTLSEASKTRTFWLMLLCMVIPSMITTGITFHIVSIVAEKGKSIAFAAMLLSITALVQFPVTFIAGYVVDNFKVHYVKAVNYVLLLIILWALMLSESSTLLIVYAIMHGVFIAFDTVSTGVLWPNYFGSGNLGSIRGVTMTAMVMGSALGPLPFGIFYDFFGGYKEIIFLMGLFPVLGAIVTFLSPAPDEPK